LSILSNAQRKTASCDEGKLEADPWSTFGQPSFYPPDHVAIGNLSPVPKDDAPRRPERLAPSTGHLGSGIIRVGLPEEHPALYARAMSAPWIPWRISQKIRAIGIAILDSKNTFSPGP
jgi:hypothetical protein